VDALATDRRRADARTQEGTPRVTRPANEGGEPLHRYVASLQAAAGNHAVTAFVQRQQLNHGRVTRQRQGLPRIRFGHAGRLPIFTLNWAVGWARIHARIAAIGDLARFTTAFSVAHLERGRAVSRHVVLPDGSTAVVELRSRRGAGQEGETKLDENDARRATIVFNRGADLARALGLARESQIAPEDAARGNAHPADLQNALDDQVFEVLVHEFTHALLLLEGAQASGPHSGAFDELEAMRAASVGGAAGNAAAQVDFEVLQLIHESVTVNATNASRAARVETGLRADPELEPSRVRDWFLRERVARTASDRAAATSMGNAALAGSYAERLTGIIRQKVGRAANIHAQNLRPAPSHSLAPRVLVWLDATVANMPSQSAAGTRSTPTMPTPTTPAPTGAGARDAGSSPR
jgi:hypothetical protein